MGKKYQIGIGKHKWFWESNIESCEFLLPLRLSELEPSRVEEDFERTDRVFVLEDLDESTINGFHKSGHIVYFSEKQAKEIIKKLQKFLQEIEK